MIIRDTRSKSLSKHAPYVPSRTIQGRACNAKGEEKGGTRRGREAERERGAHTHTRVHAYAPMHTHTHTIPLLARFVSQARSRHTGPPYSEATTSHASTRDCGSLAHSWVEPMESTIASEERGKRPHGCRDATQSPCQARQTQTQTHRHTTNCGDKR